MFIISFPALPAHTPGMYKKTFDFCGCYAILVFGILTGEACVLRLLPRKIGPDSERKEGFVKRRLIFTLRKLRL